MKPWYEPRKNRPDVPKDAPRKSGLVRFFETLWREFFELLKLNLLVLVTSLPIVTLPAALTARSRITVTMARDKNHFLWADYWKAFKRDFGKSLLGGLILLVLLVSFAVSTWFYYMLMGTSRFFVVLAAMSGCLLLATVMTGLVFFPMLAMVELPFSQLLKNSVILAFVKIKRTFPALLLWLALVGGGIGLLPYSAPYVVLLMLSLSSLVSSFLLYPAIEERVLEPEERTTAAYAAVETAAAEDSIASAVPGEFPEENEEETI